ncbi:MAG: MFS transporter [Candidatus Rokubacteria bacterium]|nr:MFS transporter [Candidatus Rokubacteria bacterium]MBI3826347.1 MFS transporter [Candidatus Rokubacteria bacterium]
MPLPSTLRALEERDFRLFWTGQCVSHVGTWMQSVGQAWLVLELTASPFRLGVIRTLQFLPVLVLAIFAGALVDRFAKRRVLLATQTAFMLQAFALSALAWSGHARYWHVAILATVYGLANTFDQPARQSFIGEVVRRDHIVNAIALNSTVMNAARLIGPALAGVLIARWGVGPAFFVNGLSFIAVLAALVAIRGGGRPAPSGPPRMRAHIAEGVRYALRDPVIGLVLLLVLLVSLFVINFNVFVPLVATEVLHGGADVFGFLMAWMGAGAILGALMLAAFGPSRPLIGLALTAAAALSGGLIALGVARAFWPAAAALVVCGFAMTVFTASCNTSLQVTVRGELRGRVMSLYAIVFLGVTPLGSLAIGALAEWVGTSLTLVISGVLGLASVLAVVALRGRRQRRLRVAG